MVLIAFIVGCANLNGGSAGEQPTSETGDYGLIAPEEAAIVLSESAGDPGFVLLDIRTDEEIETGHIPGAQSLDFYSSTFEDDIAQLDRERTYLIYCRTGNRTGQTYRMMRNMGFEEVYDLDGGITEWTRLGYAVCQGPLGAEHICTAPAPSATGTG
jgi:rhodanese-related sulfurtransferase